VPRPSPAGRADFRTFVDERGQLAASQMVQMPRATPSGRLVVNLRRPAGSLARHAQIRLKGSHRRALLASITPMSVA
jgi:predicted HTH domain antitoxin